jgi:transposase-like protein
LARDGAKGLSKGIKEVMGNKAVIQRCQWHKRENVVSYLDKKVQATFRRKLQGAYQLPTYEKAKARLLGILTDRVDRWQNSNQRQRWIGTALLNIEPRLNVVKGFKHLKELSEVMENDSNNKFEHQNKAIAA